MWVKIISSDFEVFCGVFYPLLASLPEAAKRHFTPHNVYFVAILHDITAIVNKNTN
jgi:hypothetical protein